MPQFALTDHSTPMGVLLIVPLLIVIVAIGFYWNRHP